MLHEKPDPLSPDTIAFKESEYTVPKAKRIKNEIPDDILLTLTVKEARALSQVCFSIGGTPNTSARKYFDDISEALRLVNIYTSQHPMSSTQNTIFFLDEEDM